MVSTQELLDASNAVESIQRNDNLPIAYVGSPSSPELTSLKDQSGQTVCMEDYKNGFCAEAFADQQGNVIIAYEGTDFNVADGQYSFASIAADIQLTFGQTPCALDDAIKFAKQARSGCGRGLLPANIYVTGHSWAEPRPRRQPVNYLSSLAATPSGHRDFPVMLEQVIRPLRIMSISGTQ